MRRYVLGPVVLCILVMGFVGADFGQVAQARTAVKKEAGETASEEAKTSKKATNAAQAALEGKKVSPVKRKGKAKHASAGGHKRHGNTLSGKSLKKAESHRSSELHTHIRPVSDYGFPAPETSDLLLARDSSDPGSQVWSMPEPDGLALRILESAYSCLGVPYRRGGTTPEGFDCSGFIRYVFRENGIDLRRSSREQAMEGKPVHLSELKPGDLIFFKMHQGRRARYHIDHVGLYVGNGRFIHASNNPRSREIKVDDLEKRSFFPKIVEARRILDNVQ